MNGDGGLETKWWCFGGHYSDSSKTGSVGLQLLPPGGAKEPFANSGFLNRSIAVPDHPVPMDFARNEWFPPHRDNRIPSLPTGTNYSIFSGHHHHHHHQPITHPLQLFQPPEPPRKEENAAVIGELGIRNEVPVKKRPRGGREHAENKSPPKPKRPKKAAAARGGNASTDAGLEINGVDLDISGLPTPVCSCTGTPQKCYRWGVGCWQSACCTTSMSAYPLPMSTKKKGTRIAGRKMSRGAFMKLLEKLAGEGYNLSNPIDLRTFWAKHGTNKFVTRR